MKRILFIVVTISVALLSTVALGHVVGASTPDIIGMLAWVPIAVPMKSSIKALTISMDNLRADSQADGQSVITALENQYAKAYGDDASHYAGLSHKQMIQARMQKGAKPLAFETHLFLSGIDIGNDKVDKLFVSGGDNLFSAYVSLDVEMKLLRDVDLSAVLASSTGVDVARIEAMKFDDVTADRELIETAPGENFPVTRIKVSDKMISFTKKGRALIATYEDLRGIRIPMLEMFISRIYAEIKTQKMNAIIAVMINGDGNSNSLPSGQIQDVTVSGAISDVDLINFALLMEPQYRTLGSTTYLGSKYSLAKLIKAYKDFEQFDGQYEGLGLVKPRFIQWDDGLLATGQSANDIVLNFNKNYAVMEFFTNPGVISESDTTILNQTKTRTISESTGYMKGLPQSIVALNIIP